MPDDLVERVKALGRDPRTAARVEADMGAMARRFGLDAGSLRPSEPLEMLAAETCCAACAEVRRCHAFLAGHGDRPEEFCANADRFAELASGS